MKIRFSRHARRRAKLYGITKDVIIEALLEYELAVGKNEILVSIDGPDYPLKIIAVVEDDIITVVTNYPLKKGRHDESLL